MQGATSAWPHAVSEERLLAECRHILEQQGFTGAAVDTQPTGTAGARLLGLDSGLGFGLGCWGLVVYLVSPPCEAGWQREQGWR